MSGVLFSSSLVCYSGAEGSVRWEGREIRDKALFTTYVRDVVAPRVTGSDSSFAPTLRGLATTGMATEFLGRLLEAAPQPRSWEIGEALAECVLCDDPDRELHFP